MPKIAKQTRWNSAAEDTVETGNPNVVAIHVDAANDPLDSFSPEHGGSATATRRPPNTVVRVKAAFIVAFATLLAMAAVSAGVSVLRQRNGPSAGAAVATGRVALNSRPPGAVVLIDGVSRGVTPLEIDLPAGAHAVVFRSGTSERRLDVKADATIRVSENVDMPSAPASTGVLEVTSAPAGARVSMDGTAAGVTPLTLRNVAAARHSLTISLGSNSVNRTVEVASGTAASVFVSLGQSTASSGGSTGTFGVESPLELRILENGKLLGLSNAAPIVVSAGKHQFDLVNEALELHLTRTVSVDAGKPTRLSVTLPNGTLSVNAVPWAEVFVDGKAIGVTPLGSVSVPVGSHEILWRHPQLGDKRRTAVVAAQSPVRITMDMTK
jgi:serine/threonine-protein kinase